MLSDLPKRHFVGHRIPSVFLDTLHDEIRLSLVEESILVREVDDEEETEDGEEYSEESEKKENPLPSGETGLSVEQRHAV